MSSNASLSAVADDRKARLANLRNLKRKQPADEVAAPESQRSPSPPAEKKKDAALPLSGRNYDVETRAPKMGFEAPPNLSTDKPTLEEQALTVEEEARKRAEQESKDDKGVDLFKLQPKKPNWDLKRDLEKKTEVLNVRTDNAIARLVRERISNKQKEKQKTEETPAQADGEAIGMDGVALVEGLRMREKEEEEEERRQREEAEMEA